MVSLRFTALVGGAMAGLGTAVRAADIALVIGNAGAADPAAVALMVEQLNARGYEVYDRQAASRDEIAAALAEVADRLPDADRLILVFAGETQAAGSDAWLLPEDFGGEGRIETEFSAVRLDLLLDLAGTRPGRAAVVIGGAQTTPETSAEFADLDTGIGVPEVPQGVLLISGPADAAVAAVAEGLLGEGPVAAALAGLPEELAVQGYLSPEAAFVQPAGTPAPRPEPQADPETVAAAVAPAEAAEAALALDQTARRRIQERLTVLGYNTRGIDGIFGPGTRAAVAQWQTAQDLQGTGYLRGEQIDLLTALADARSAELAAAAERARQEEEAADAALWRSTGANGGEADLRDYLDRYPAGIHAGEARSELDRLEAAAQAQAGAGDRAAWDRAQVADRPRAYRRYLEDFPEGAFRGRARARLDALNDEPARAQAEEAAAAGEEGLGLGQGSRALIEGQLAAIGYDVGATDGRFDDTSRQALREFQTRQGLEVTGYVNQPTVQALIIASLGLR